ncbi:MAG: TonB-dependent receptor [Chitinophagaceae bacterium]
MKNSLLISLCLFISLYVSAQGQDTIVNQSLNEIVISGTKFSEKKKNIAQKIDKISSEELIMMNAQTSADALTNSSNVFVQKSQMGGGSPVIRGFEASRIQLSIDGIKHNNAIFRAGHLQNIVSIDNNALEAIEILNGPASSVHGSDALGGVILLKTIEPKLGKSKKIKLTGAQALARYASANQEQTVNIGIHFGNTKWASFTNATYSRFGDLMQGKVGEDSIIALWKKNFIIARNNGRDTMLVNENSFLQSNTGYNQLDILQKFIYFSSANTKHSLNLQYSNSSNVPRYDRLTELNNVGIAKNAEWYYGPQKRALAAYQFNKTAMPYFFDECLINVNYQALEESRNNRKFNNNNLQHRKENIGVAAYAASLRHSDKIHELIIGTDGQLNFLTSKAFQQNIETGYQEKIDTRYPDGKNQMNLFGIFAQHISKWIDGKLVTNSGIRFNYTTLHSTLVDTSILFHLPFTDLNQKNSALTANLGVVYMPSEELRFTANISSGFRSPNFDDMTKVFESNAGILIVPNENLKPEYTKNADVSFLYDNGKIQLGASGFYTQFTNAIVTDVFTYQGQDSVLYNGSMTRVFASQNKGQAFVYGGGVNMLYRFTKHFSMSGNYNYTYGRYAVGDTAYIPLDHIPPTFGKISLMYKQNKWYAELYSLFNGNKKLKDYSPSGEDNLQYATPTGMPSWSTINLRAGATISEEITIQGGVENILDKNYRYFASGISAAGRNFIVALRFKM